MVHEMPKLPYAMDALTPSMSKETLEYHYGKHLQAYVDNLNRLIPATVYETMSLDDIVLQADGAVFNNAAQAWNHTFFFESLTPTAKAVPGELEKLLVENFGSLDAFKEQFVKAAASLFGSGWVWLVKDGQNMLSVVSESNAGNPMKKGLKPLLVIDVWEHAYYIDYRNRRADYINAFWKLVDWDKVSERCFAI